MNKARVIRRSEPATEAASEDSAERSAEVIDLRRERTRRAHPSWRASTPDT